MRVNKLKQEWITLFTNSRDMENKYFYGQVIEVLSMDEGQVVLVEGYLDNQVTKVVFPELKNLLNDELYTPIKLFLNGGKTELLDEENMLQTLENLNSDFSLEETPYFLYEDLRGEQSTFAQLSANDEVSKYYINFWKEATAKPFDGMTQNEVDGVISKYNLPLKIENKPKQLLFGTVLFSIIGLLLLYIFIEEEKQDFMMLATSMFLIFGAGLSLFLYVNPTMVTLTRQGIEVKGLRSFQILWSEIDSIDIFANQMISYIPNESSSKKRVFGGYVIPLQQKPLEETLLMLRELHYFYGEYSRERI